MAHAPSGKSDLFSRAFGAAAAAIHAHGFLAFAAIFAVGCLFIIAVGSFAVVILLIASAAFGIHWYKTQKAPSTADLAAVAGTTPQPFVFPSVEDFVVGLMVRLTNADAEPSPEMLKRYVTLTSKLYEDEDLVNPVPPLPPGGDIEEGRYRDRLLTRSRKLGGGEQTLQLVSNALGGFLLEFNKSLPQAARQAVPTALARVPLKQLLSDIPEIVHSIYRAFFAPELVEAGLFQALRDQLDSNLNNASGRKGELVWPKDSKLSDEELLGTYLAHTPFLDLFNAQVPFSVSLSKQLEHQMVVGGTRWGKSQAMGMLIDQHLSQADPPGLIVIDSQGDFLSKISRLELFHPDTGKLKDRILIINPEDAAAPALNMFDVSELRAKGYKPEEIESVEAEIIHLFNYVFASLATEMTGQQSGTFSFLVRLMLTMPGSNITTLRELLQDDAVTYAAANPKFRKYIEKLDPTAQDFFKTQYYTRSLSGTRAAIARRLFNVVQVPVFERMFADANKVDFADAMNKGKIIVVNTAKTTLKPEASALFGRYIIARIIAGAFERVTIPMEKRRPCIMFVDEAQEYFDDSLDTLLTQIAKFKLGICIAFQYVEQLPNKLRSSVIGNTTVKYVGGVTFQDARYLAREMRVTEQMVLAQKKDAREPPQWAQFATFVRNYTEHAIPLTVSFYALENRPKMDEQAYRRLLEANRRSIGVTEPAPASAPSETESEAEEGPQQPAPRSRRQSKSDPAAPAKGWGA